MSTYRLDKLFHPRSIALVGASPQEGSLGAAVLRNLLAAGFSGRIYLVNPRYDTIDGMAAAATLDTLPETPDMVVVVTPAATVPDIIATAGRRGVASAIIMSAGLGHGPASLADKVKQTARAHGLRLVGPNCFGVVAPAAKLNTAFGAHMPIQGDLAVVSQSGGVAAGLIEWAVQRGIGLSAAVSIGDKIDVDFGDLLDYFAVDRATRAILVYMESVNDARKFMSAARAAARVKPVVVLKSGRHAQGAKAAATHTGALAGADAVYDAAFRRAGLLRVADLGELFDAAETLTLVKSYRGRRLAVLTNGGGMGVLAVDRMIDLGGAVAELAADTYADLDRVLPPTWSKDNPVDIIGDADAARYEAALEPLLADRNSDAVLVMNVQTALGSSAETARSVIAVAQRHRARFLHPKPILVSWIGDEGPATKAFEAAGLPHFATEADAVRGFMHLVRYYEARDALMETPPSILEDFTPNTGVARGIAAEALSDGRTWLDPMEITQLFEAYGIPIVSAHLARNGEEAAAAAAPILASGATVAVKICSRDIVHKSDVGGVRLNLASESAVREAAAEILTRAHALRPDARIAGVTIHPTIVRPKARELIAGLADDPTFGPVIVFGRGGTAVEVINDKALALPPLDLRMANDLIARTRVSRALEAYRSVPAAKKRDVALVLVKLAQLAADVPEIREVDINPLFADDREVLAVDARVAVGPVGAKSLGPGNPRFSVRPYPKEWERHLTLADGKSVLIRPLRPEDEVMFPRFLDGVTKEDLRLRFFAPIKQFSHTFIARLTQLDYARAMAFVAIDEETREMMGVVRLHADANYETGEYAILLRSDLKGKGLGWQLMQLMIGYAKSEGLMRIEGQVLCENAVMLAMCRELGFRIENDPADVDISTVTLELPRSTRPVQPT